MGLLKINGRIKNFTTVDFPISFTRQGDFPLDSTSIFDSLSAAQEYTANDPTAYKGQIIAIIDESSKSVVLKVIGYTGTLIDVCNIRSADGLSVMAEDGILSLAGFKSVVKAGMTCKTKATENGKFTLEWIDLDESFKNLTDKIDAIEEKLDTKVSKSSAMEVSEVKSIIDKYRA